MAVRIQHGKPQRPSVQTIQLIHTASPERVRPDPTLRYGLLDVARIARAVLEAPSMQQLRTLLQQQIHETHAATLPLGRIIGKGKQSRVYALRQFPDLVAKEYYFTEHVVKARSRSAPSSGRRSNPASRGPGLLRRGETMNSIARRYRVPCRALYTCNQAVLRRQAPPQRGKTAHVRDRGAWISPSAPLRLGLRLVVPKGGQALLDAWTSPPPGSASLTPGLAPSPLGQVASRPPTTTPQGTRCYRCRHAFLSEAIVVSLLSTVHCPHIVHYDGFLFHEAVAYIVMERLHSNLRDAFRNDPQRYGTLRMVKALLWQCCIAILAMQTSYRIVHYDMNAYNIFLTNNNNNNDDDANTPYHAYAIRDDSGKSVRFTMPNVGVTAKLGDFGFAGAFMRNGPHVVRDDVHSQRFEYKYNIANGFQCGYDVLFLLSCFDFSLRRHIYPRIRNRAEVKAIRAFMNQIARDVSQSMRRRARSPLTVRPNNTMYDFITETCHHETLRPRRRYSLLASPRHVLNSTVYADYRVNRPEAPVMWRES